MFRRTLGSLPTAALSAKPGRIHGQNIQSLISSRGTASAAPQKPSAGPASTPSTPATPNIPPATAPLSSPAYEPSKAPSSTPQSIPRSISSSSSSSSGKSGQQGQQQKKGPSPSGILKLGALGLVLAPVALGVYAYFDESVIEEHEKTNPQLAKILREVTGHKAKKPAPAVVAAPVESRSVEPAAPPAPVEQQPEPVPVVAAEEEKQVQEQPAVVVEEQTKEQEPATTIAEEEPRPLTAEEMLRQAEEELKAPLTLPLPNTEGVFDAPSIPADSVSPFSSSASSSSSSSSSESQSEESSTPSESHAESESAPATPVAVAEGESPSESSSVAVASEPAPEQAAASTPAAPAVVAEEEEIEESPILSLEALEQALRFSKPVAEMSVDELKHELSRLQALALGITRDAVDAMKESQEARIEQFKEDAEIVGYFLSHVEADFKAEMEKQRNDMTTAHSAEVTALRTRYDEVLRTETERQRSEYEQLLRQRLESQREELARETRERLAEADRQLRYEFNQERASRLQELQTLYADFVALERLSQTHSDYQRDSHVTHQLATAIFALEDAALQSARPFGQLLNSIRSLASSDSTGLIAASLDAFPGTSTTTGLPTLRLLQDRFDGQVLHAVRRASFLPPTANPSSLLATAWAYVADFLTFSETGVVSREGAKIGLGGLPNSSGWIFSDASNSSVDAILARAKYNLDRGDLAATINEMDRLTGQSALAARDWLEDARERSRAEIALRGMKAHAQTLSSSLS